MFLNLPLSPKPTSSRLNLSKNVFTIWQRYNPGNDIYSRDGKRKQKKYVINKVSIILIYNFIIEILITTIEILSDCVYNSSILHTVLKMHKCKKIFIFLE